MSKRLSLDGTTPPQAATVRSPGITFGTARSSVAKGSGQQFRCRAETLTRQFLPLNA
jgi:hypothetical protein